MAEPEIELEFVEDLTPAAWVSDDPESFGWNVGAVIPPGFDAYARVFHPAALAGVPVSWRAIATAHGMVFLPEVQFESISSRDRWDAENRDLWDQTPVTGNARDIVSSLLDALLPHTSTPERGWFCVWEGRGGMPRPDFEAKVHRPLSRAYYLMHGPLSAVLDESSVVGNYGANIWWPEDRAWCVATEIDYHWTYVGGTRQLIEDLLADPELEALPTQLTDRVAVTGDVINGPWPPR